MQSLAGLGAPLHPPAAFFLFNSVRCAKPNPMAKQIQHFCGFLPLAVAVGSSDGTSLLQSAWGIGGAGRPALPWPF